MLALASTLDEKLCSTRDMATRGLSIEEFVVVDDRARREIVLGDDVLTIGAASDCDFVVLAGARLAVAVRLSATYVDASERCIVGGIPLEAGRRRRLVGPCTLRLGAFALRVELRAAAAVSTRRLAFGLVAQLLGADPVVVVVEGQNVDRALVIGAEGELQAGRSSRTSLQLDDSNVSREHVAFTRRGSEVILRDLGTTGGTYLGGVRLQPHAWAVWDPDVMVLVGSTVLALRVPDLLARALDAEPPVRAPTSPMPTSPTMDMEKPSERAPRPLENAHPSPASFRPLHVPAAPLDGAFARTARIARRPLGEWAPMIVPVVIIVGVVVVLLYLVFT